MQIEKHPFFVRRSSLGLGVDLGGYVHAGTELGMLLLDATQQLDGTVGLVHLLTDGDEGGMEMGVT